MKPGYLYILTNESYPGYVKIGCSEDIKSRLKTYQTGDPHRKYKMIYYIYFPGDCFKAEKRIKEMMKYFATDTIQKGEWYRISPHMAISRLEETVSDYEEGLFK